jgi:hypothetical protein
MRQTFPALRNTLCIYLFPVQLGSIAGLGWKEEGEEA